MMKTQRFDGGVMEYIEWQVLTQEWAKALSKARIKEAVIADRMNSFLKGNGCLPSLEDLAEVEALWQAHVEKRTAMNNYVARIIHQYPESNHRIPSRQPSNTSDNVTPIKPDQANLPSSN
jgi:hypothetical protein